MFYCFGWSCFFFYFLSAFVLPFCERLDIGVHHERYLAPIHLGSTDSLLMTLLVGPTFWSLGISRRTYGFTLVRPCVRAFVRARRDIWRSAHQIFLKLGTKLHLGEAKKMFQADFWKKFSFSRFWPKTANFCHFWPFLAKKSGFWTFSSNPHIRFV